jgi:nitrate reductase NapD
MNVSSIVLKAKAEHFDDVLAGLKESEICDVHFHDEMGRIVVTIEGENINEEMDKMKLLSQTPNVLSAEMIYAYSEDEIAEAKDKFERIDNPVPEELRE